MKKRIIYITVVLLALFLCLEAGFYIWRKAQINRARPKAEMLLTALESIMEMREAEIKIKEKHGSVTMGRCIDFQIAAIKNAKAKNESLDIKDFLEQNKDMLTEKCLSYYKEQGNIPPGLKVRENFTIHDDNFDYALFNDSMLMVTEAASAAMSLDGLIKGYVILYYLPKETADSPQKIEVECAGQEYWKGVCHAISARLLEKKPRGADFIILKKPKKTGLE